MQWIPAIDLKDGQVVRLVQGRMDQATVYSKDPVEMAKRWQGEGATRVHIVDLNGAFLGKPVNLEIIRRMIRKIPSLELQVGGGIRTAATIQQYLDSGVRYCILGTVAIKDRALATALFQQFTGQLILGLDAKNGHVAGEGWAEESVLDAATVAHYYEAYDPVAIIYTDISRDGMLTGPNLEAARALAQQTRTPVMVSGGIASLEDLKRIQALHGTGIIGAILGKALYEGRFSYREAALLR